MRYGSLCSGIESATVAWRPLGWSPAFFSEIDAFPRAVLQHHYPSVPLHGDLRAIRADKLTPIDVLVAGFPCQDVSVAGKKEGLVDDDGEPTRSGLVYDIIKLSDTIGQRWTVLENVLGLLSIYRWKDFASVVRALSGATIPIPPSGWPNTGFALGSKGLVEWRILDAQFFNLAQRRKRLFIIRDTGEWRNRPPILLERDSLHGSAPPSRRAEKKTAPSPVSGVASCGAALTASNSYDHTGRESHLIAFDCKSGGHTGFSIGACPGSLRGEGYGGGHAAVATELAVRRLTPREWERLQGLPDDYTRIPWRGRPCWRCPDGVRYKAIGNGMPVPVMRWIGERIQMADQLSRSCVQPVAEEAN